MEKKEEKYFKGTIVSHSVFSGEFQLQAWFLQRIKEAYSSMMCSILNQNHTGHLQMSRKKGFFPRFYSKENQQQVKIDFLIFTRS